MRSAAGLLTRGSPFAAFPALRPVAFPRRASPLTAAGPSRTCTGFPHRAPYVGADPIIGRCRPPPRCACGRRSSSGRPSSSPSPRCPTSAPASVPGISCCGRSLTPPSSRCSGRCCCGRSATSGRRSTAGIAYAISDELHQHFVPGRVGSPLDVAIDAVGVVAGVVLWQRYRAPGGVDPPDDLLDLRLLDREVDEAGARRDGRGQLGRARLVAPEREPLARPVDLGRPARRAPRAAAPPPRDRRRASARARSAASARRGRRPRSGARGR